MYRNDLNLLPARTLGVRSAGEHADESVRAGANCTKNSPSTVLGEIALVLIVALSFLAAIQIVLGRAFL